MPLRTPFESHAAAARLSDAPTFADITERCLRHSGFTLAFSLVSIFTEATLLGGRIADLPAGDSGIPAFVLLRIPVPYTLAQFLGFLCCSPHHLSNAVV